MNEIQEHLWNEYKEYIKETPMTNYERNLLRKWVSEGHSVYQDPGSCYLCDPYPPRSFLDAYREDKRIADELRGLPVELSTKYLKDYMGYDD